ncbi:MAG: response regulator [Desulfovibrio sp.]|nr:response regulator [Desulfovibrio sp.]
MDRSRRTILVTERNANIRELLRRELGRAGFSVLTAACPAEALGKLRAEPGVGLVILDGDQPEGETGEVEEFLGRDGPPVILHCFSPGEVGGRETGRVVAVVQKGGDPGQLTAAVAGFFSTSTRSVPGARNVPGSDPGG